MLTTWSGLPLDDARANASRGYALAVAMLRWDHLRRRLAEARRLHRSTQIERQELRLFVRGMLESNV